MHCIAFCCRELTDNVRSVIINSLNAILSCNFTAVYKAIFLHRFMTLQWTQHLSYSMTTFKSCLREQTNIKDCLPLLTRNCVRSRVVAVKVIRLPINLVEELLNADSQLRVIHLVRDPRGMMQSWKKFSVPKPTDEEMRISAKIACNRMLKDCVSRRRLERTFPGRILLVRYEDLVIDTDRVLDDIYSRLLRLPVPKSVRNGMLSQLNADSNDSDVGTRRKNGTATASDWKQTVDKRYLIYVNKTCSQVLSLLNYDRS